MIIHFLDTETTGLDPTLGAELIELACCSWNDGAVVELIEKPYLPKNGCPENVAKLNGYDEAAWLGAGAKLFEIADAKEIFELLAGAFIGGSNPDFDKRMIEAACHRTGQPKPKWSHRSLNTASLGFPLWVTGQTESTGLAALATFFGIEHAAHTAMGDVKASIAVWEALFDMYVHRPRVMREALTEIANDEQGDADVRTFAAEALGGWGAVMVP